MITVNDIITESLHKEINELATERDILRGKNAELEAEIVRLTASIALLALERILGEASQWRMRMYQHEYFGWRWKVWYLDIGTYDDIEWAQSCGLLHPPKIPNKIQIFILKRIFSIRKLFRGKIGE